MNKFIATVFAILLLPMLAVAGPVNVNKADAETIARELKGVGPVKAKAIVEYRELNGPFESVDDLQKVKGIGPKTIENNRKDILLEDEKKE